MSVFLISKFRKYDMAIETLEYGIISFPKKLIVPYIDIYSSAKIEMSKYWFG